MNVDQSYSLGLDIGGTFTDFVLVNDQTGEIIVHKYLTSYPDASVGVLAGLEEVLSENRIDIGAVRVIVHSTTLVTNAIIARAGAKAGLLFTDGFPNVLDLGREQRYDAYEIFLTYPEPLIQPQFRRPVEERITRDGVVLTAPRRDQVLAGVQSLVDRGVESLAICLMHSYANPENERAVASMVRDEFPSLFLSLSSDVAPLIGEWERTSTTAADAYVRPIVDTYLTRIENDLRARGFTGNIYMTLSSGGTGSISTAKQYPVRLLESGPAAGVLAAGFYGKLTETPDLLVFDMGGTTAKTCLVEDYTPYVSEQLEVARVHRFKRGSGLPIKVPTLELLEIGAGGGSIARMDDLGLLKVGPDSAGADPGPACYGRGGEEPTVTDANLLLGYYDPNYFVGGRMKLDTEASQRAVSRLGRDLGLSAIDTAWGIHQLVNENMASAARIHVIERGRDPRNFAIVAFGGGGPAHGTGVAAILGARRIIIPLGAGATSALGSLAAPFSFHMSRTYVAAMAGVDWDAVNKMYADLEEQGRQLLVEAGAKPEEIEIRRTADMRMLGQFHEIRVELPNGTLSPDSRPAIRKNFNETYRSRYSYLNEDIDLEFVHWHVEAVAYVPHVEIKAHDAVADPSPAPAQKGTRSAYFAQARDFIETPVYDRYKLQPGMAITGPALIEERESTAILRPGDYATVDKVLNLVVEVGA